MIFNPLLKYDYAQKPFAFVKVKSKSTQLWV